MTPAQLTSNVDARLPEVVLVDVPFSGEVEA